MAGMRGLVTASLAGATVAGLATARFTTGLATLAGFSSTARARRGLGTVFTAADGSARGATAMGGSDTVGSDTAGSGTAGSGTAGSGTAGSGTLSSALAAGRAAPAGLRPRFGLAGNSIGLSVIASDAAA